MIEAAVSARPRAAAQVREREWISIAVWVIAFVSVQRMRAEPSRVIAEIR